MRYYSKYLRSICRGLALFMVFTTVNSQELPSNKGVKKPVTYVIKTQVQGSQEQPKVIYITPWQELNSTLSIDDHQLTIKLPELAPVNPKIFREKVKHYFYQQKTVKEN